MTIEDKLRLHAERRPQQTACVCGENRCSYGQLYEMVCRKAATLSHLRGRVIALKATPSIDFVATYFAIHMAGAVAMPYSPGLPASELKRCMDALEGHLFAPEIADMLYTTGTTGTPKCVMVSHRAIAADAENLVEAQGFTSDLTYIINGPLNHIGSLSKLYPTIWAGGTIHIIDGMKNLGVFFEAIEAAPEKVATFLVPASIRMLMAFAKAKLAACAHKIDFIETGAAPMAQSDMEQLCRLLPSSRLYNTYASTETGIISTFNFNAGECIAGCLGKPMRHSSLLITPEGLVACKGETLMSGYWNAPEETQRILRDGTIYTSDFGYLDEKGRLRLKGRNDDIINVGGYKVSPVEVEDAALSFPAVKDCVCTTAVHPVIGLVLKLLVVPIAGFSVKALAEHLRTRLEPHKLPTLYESVERIRRTFNGKIDRKSYR